MNHASKLKELIIRRQLKHLHRAPSSHKNSGPRGIILGMRSGSRPPDSSDHNLDSEVEETVMSCLLEEPRRDLLVPLSALSRRMLPESQPLLEEVLKKMESQHMIKIVATDGGEIGVKLTLEGAVRTLYGDWFLDYVPNFTLMRNGEQKRHAPAPIARQTPSRHA